MVFICRTRWRHSCFLHSCLRWQTPALVGKSRSSLLSFFNNSDEIMIWYVLLYACDRRSIRSHKLFLGIAVSVRVIIISVTAINVTPTVVYLLTFESNRYRMCNHPRMKISQNEMEVFLSIYMYTSIVDISLRRSYWSSNTRQDMVADATTLNRWEETLFFTSMILL